MSDQEPNGRTVKILHGTASVYLMVTAGRYYKTRVLLLPLSEIMA